MSQSELNNNEACKVFKAVQLKQFEDIIESLAIRNPEYSMEEPGDGNYVSKEYKNSYDLSDLSFRDEPARFLNRNTVAILVGGKQIGCLKGCAGAGFKKLRDSGKVLRYEPVLTGGIIRGNHNYYAGDGKNPIRTAERQWEDYKLIIKVYFTE